MNGVRVRRKGPAVKDPDGNAVERYCYDKAGRLVREGNKTYRYGYLDKVLSVTDGDMTRTYTYHAALTTKQEVARMASTALCSRIPRLVMGASSRQRKSMARTL